MLQSAFRSNTVSRLREAPQEAMIVQKESRAAREMGNRLIL